MKQEIQCPKCRRGSLAPMTEQELKRAGLLEKAKKSGDIYLGCDECQYYEY